MANIDPAPSWANIRRLETTDRNMAGPGGILNDPTTSIAARLNLLRDNDTTLGSSVAEVNSRQDATDIAIANIQGQVLNAPGTLSDLENGAVLDPAAAFPDVSSVENSLGPVDAINSPIESLTARTKQLRDEIAASTPLGQTIFNFGSAVGSDITEVLNSAIAAVGAGEVPSRTLVVPPGDWTVSERILFPLSNFTLVLQGNIRLTSLTRQVTLMFASDPATVPASILYNVRLVGIGTVDGNGAAMTFNYSHGDGSDNDSAVRFNRVWKPVVEGVWVKNGPIDSLSFRQCKQPLVRAAIVTNAKEDNGLSITTDWLPDTWSYLDPTTWSMGTVEDCLMFDNRDFGGTAFNATGVRFVRCLAWNNSEGFSYEDAFSTPNVKSYAGQFIDCYAFNNLYRGWYIDADDVRVDDGCKSWGHTQFTGDNSALNYNAGIVVSNVAKAYVGGDHSFNGACGLALFNGTTQPMHITCSGRYEQNGANGVYGRGANLRVVSGTRVLNNGRVLVNGAYSAGVRINNSGATYLQGVADVAISDVEISGSGQRALHLSYIRNVRVSDCFGTGNLFGITGPAVEIDNTANVFCLFNDFTSSTGNQTFGYNITSTCTYGYEFGNTGSGTTGIVVNAATNTRTIRMQQTASAIWSPSTIASDSQATTTISVPGTDVGDQVSVSFSADIGLLQPYARVSSGSTVTVALRNFTAGSITPPTGMTVRVIVTRRNGG